ncbi:hypothetical protein Pelo_17984 [Pelomyxa schiedti]|nr:hypothetical protein Pelo_17984 [Pelomyxa schiedti]
MASGNNKAQSLQRKQWRGAAVSVVAMVRAGDQFAALMASSLPRCGALSPARPVCLVAPLARHLWCEWVAGPGCAAVASVTLALVSKGGGAAGQQSVAFGVSRTTLGVATRGGRVAGTTGDTVSWAAPGVSLQRTWGMFGAISLRLQRRGWGTATTTTTGTGTERDGVLRISREGVVCDAVNSKWWVTCEREVVRDARGGIVSASNCVTLAVTGIHCYTTATATTITTTTSSCETAGLTVPCTAGIDVPWVTWEANTRMRMFMNNIFPDEALFALSCVSTQEVSLTLFDVHQARESRRISVLARTSMGTRGMQDGACSALVAVPSFQGVPVHALVLRRRKTDGSIVFILKPLLGTVYQVEAATGLTTVLSARCSDLSQLSDTMFCIGRAYGCEKSYELWDCHNAEQPVRCFQSSDNFDQVIAGCGFLFAVSESDRKIHVIDASSGLAAMITLEKLKASQRTSS